MTEEERIERLENQIKNFRIISSGDGIVQGGFGELSHGDSLNERIAKLEKAVAGFGIEGDGVNVAGSFNEGYLLS